MRQEDTTKITERCFQGEPASCSHGCPFFFDIRTFLLRAKEGKWGLAYKLYRNAVVFPGIVSKLCGAPCRAECQRGFVLGEGEDESRDAPVDVRAIEAAVCAYAKDQRPVSYRIPPKDKRVAVIGAGIGGLAAALGLAQKGYGVTIFRCGGEPEDALTQFQDEIDLQFSAVKVSWEDGAVITEPDAEPKDFDAVLKTQDKGTDTLSCCGQQDRVSVPLSCVFSIGGSDPISSLAAGIAVVNDIEAWLMTNGAAGASSPGSKAPRPQKQYLDHPGEVPLPLIVASDPAQGYTKEEAIAEAQRCMGCDCRKCFDVCEMLMAFGKHPQKIAVEAYADTKAVPPFSSCSLTRETYSCNLCGKCKEVCPVEIDLRELFALAREGRAETGKQPKAYHDFWLRDFAWHRGEGSYASLTEAGYVFFPGCKLGERMPAQVEKAAALLKEEYGAGILLDCCGAPAYWAGETALFEEHLAGIRTVWESVAHPTFVFACAYCQRIFAERLPEITGVSLYELLTQAEGPSLSASSPSALVFDPCAAADFPAMRAAVRSLAARAGVVTEDLPAAEAFRCCGFGGHMRLANPDLYESIATHRAAVGAGKYLVYCANCADAFDLAGRENVHILDLVFGEPTGMAGGLGARRAGAVRAKDALMRLYEGTHFVPEAKPWDQITLTIPQTLLGEMDGRLLTEDDLKEAIYTAGKSGDRFSNGDLYQCSLAGSVITVWVQYRQGDHGNYDYAIIDAWSHRMHIEADV
jgi:Fe-S oxidoreductase